MRFITGPLLVLLLFVPSAWAEESPEPTTPRIGLVLSGGGARGAAHVGVLKVLEELRVPVHFIAGTSAGALVGGMYAVGMSPEEIEQLLVEMDWEDLLDDRPPRRELPYRRKQDDLTYLTRFEVGFNRGRFQLPPGLVIGQKLGLLLERVTLPVVGIEDFDELPVPFRAVATDIRRGQLVVLDRGDLSGAMRASMSIPGVFAPLEMDGKLLIDGGIVMNLPVEVAREMGAEVVIAVDVGNVPPDEERLRSVLGVFSQTVTAIVRESMEEQAKMANVLITPMTGDISSMDFARSAEAIRFGEEEARRHLDELRHYSLSEEQYTAYRRRFDRLGEVEGVVTAVQVGAGSKADPEQVLRRIKTRPGDPLDLEKIRRDVQSLYELGDYERVSYRLFADDGGYALFIDADERSWGPHTMRFGISLVSDFEGSSAFNLLASYTMTALNRRRAEAKIETQLGNDPTLRAEFYQPLDRSGHFFGSVHVQGSNHVVNLWVEQGIFAEYKARQAASGVDLGVQFGKYGELRLGLTRSSLELEPESERLGFETLEIDSAGYRAALVLDQMDDPSLPREGYWGSAELYLARESLGSDDEYERLGLGFGVAATYDRHTGITWMEAHSALGSDLPVYARYRLGGLFSLSGYETGALSGRYGGMFGLAYMFELFHSPNFVRRVAVGTTLETGSVWESQSDVSFGDLKLSGSVFLGVDTMLGPIYLGYGHAEKGENAWYLYMGRFF